MRMLCPVVLSFAICICAVMARAQVSAPQPPSKSTDEAHDYSKEGYVVEQFRTRYSFESDGTGKRELSARIKVQSEAGVQQWGQLVLGYNSANERVEIPYVRVLKADGSTVTAQPDAVQDLSAPVEREAPVYTDYRQKHVTVPGLRPGEVLEYDIVFVIFSALAPGQFWVEHNFTRTGIVLDEQLEVNTPSGRNVKLKTQPGIDPKISEANGRRTYVWTSSHREREEESSEKDKKAKPKKPPGPEVQMTTFANWEEMGRWYAGLEKDRRHPTAEVRSKAAQLTAGKTGDIEKIQALYDYVATNFHYISLSFGVGRFQPHSAADVLHNQYGDCKDKHTLLASLLEASGYHASSVLINSSRKLDPDVPSPSQFDHMISVVPLPTEEVWMDTTTEVAPFRMLAPTLRKKEALVIPQEGTPHLEETPADPPQPDSYIQELEGKVNEFGKLDAHIKLVTRGDAELFMRVVFRRVQQADWKDLLTRMAAMGGLSGEVSDLKVGDPSATAQPFQVEFHITAANFIDWVKKKSELTLPMSHINLPDADEGSADPQEGVQLGSPSEVVLRTRLEFPAKYVVRAPLPFSMKRDYAQYEATYKIEGGVFSAQRRLVTSARDLPVSRVSDYAAFRNAALADVGQRLSVDSTAAGTPVAPSDLKGDDLSDAANAALERGNFQIAVDLLKRLLETEPKHKTAWVTLGRAYMGLRDTDHAIEAFGKQAELNDYDEYAFNSLGWAYSTARKYEQAAAAYQKAIEINPLSNYAHAALGRMYAEQHKYESAAPELEKAASLKPDDPFLQINLGDAYLNLGQDDKALAAFDRAIELSATPLTWNNVAYQLALKNAHLDRARQYAESAVSATVAASRNFSLEQLSERDLGTVQSLAAYWDTLAWVYLKTGDAERAEKYLRASWLLAQLSDVGDHLGQVYEKLGRKQDAIQAYSLALAALRPDPEVKERLEALTGKDKVRPASAMVDELQALRTFKLGKIGDATGDAEFFVMLVNTEAGPSVAGVKFISGDEGMKAFADKLKAVKYNMIFPDDAPARIVRRGILSCSKATGECTFVLRLPQDVRSVN